MLLLGLEFEQDLKEKNYIKRIFIFIIYLEIVSISTSIGKALVANFKVSEFSNILVSYIGFIIKLINSKALYNYYTKFLSIRQVIITIYKEVLIIIVTKNMISFKMSTRGWNKVYRHIRQDLLEKENYEKRII